jgi:hypothetical protein
MEGPLRGHERLDQRSLALHRAIAEKLRAHPELIAIAKENLERWSATEDPRSRRYSEAWQEILNLPMTEILRLITEESERMTAMRQATPFAGVLDPAERWAVYDQFAAQNP